MMLKLTKLSLAIQLIWLVLATSASEDASEIESIVQNDNQQQTPEVTYRLMQDIISKHDATDEPGLVGKLRAYSDYNDVSAERCSTSGIVKLKYDISVVEELKQNKLKEYLEDCFIRQMDFCFENLPKQFENTFNNLDASSRANFDKFMKSLDPQLTPARDFALQFVFSSKYDVIAKHLDWQIGRRLENKSDFECNNKCPLKEQYKIFLKSCGQVYSNLFEAASLMLYLIQLRPNKEHEMSPELVEWYKRYKVAYDLTARGERNYEDFEKYIKTERLGPTIADKIKSFFSRHSS